MSFKKQRSQKKNKWDGYTEKELDRTVHHLIGIRQNNNGELEYFTYDKFSSRVGKDHSDGKLPHENPLAQCCLASAMKLRMKIDPSDATVKLAVQGSLKRNNII